MNDFTASALAMGTGVGLPAAIGYAWGQLAQRYAPPGGSRTHGVLRPVVQSSRLADQIHLSRAGWYSSKPLWRRLYAYATKPSPSLATARGLMGAYMAAFAPDDATALTGAGMSVMTLPFQLWRDVKNVRYALQTGLEKSLQLTPQQASNRLVRFMALSRLMRPYVNFMTLAPVVAYGVRKALRD